MDDFVAEKVEAEANEWMAKHPLRDDDIGTHAEEMHEEALHDFKIDAEEYWTEKYMEELLPAALEEFEMHLEVE